MTPNPRAACRQHSELASSCRGRVGCAGRLGELEGGGALKAIFFNRMEVKSPGAGGDGSTELPLERSFLSAWLSLC